MKLHASTLFVILLRNNACFKFFYFLQEKATLELFIMANTLKILLET